MRDDRHADAGSSQVGSPARARQLADLVLRQPDLVERAADAELARRLPPGPVVAAIVGVAAVDDRRECRARAPIAVEVRVELVLAVVAAVRGVGAVLGARHFVGRG